MSQIVLSGVRATGRLHLGNYIGAMRNFVALQEQPDHKCYFFIADYHTLTTAPDPKDLHTHLPGIAAGFIAAGLDPERSTIYAQSSVPEVAELALILSMVAPVNQLLSLPTYREKAEQHAENVNMGLLNYPILMAADILGPKATLVPVGEDQLKHIELARDLARRFNNRYGQTFEIPEAMLEEAVRVPGLDGSGKMGKSDDNTIDLLDSGQSLWDKIRVGVTDTARQRRTDPGDPDICPMFGIHRLITAGSKLPQITQGCRSATMGCIDCKKILHQEIDSLLSDYRDRYTTITNRPQDITEILYEGGKKARRVFRATVLQARDAMGLPNLLEST